MSQPWTYLRKRFGAELGAPTEKQITEAANELFNENLPGMTKADYDEHESASLRFGYDEGPMYEVRIDRLGEATLEVWADQDYEVEAKPARVILSVSKAHAVTLWSMLASGSTASVEDYFDTNS